MTYVEKLKRQEWKRIRTIILQREDFTCENCGAVHVDHQVHHEYYENGKEPWEYPTESLHCLCPSCHEQTEYALKLLRRVLGGAAGWQIEGLAKAIKAQRESGRKIKDILADCQMTLESDAEFVAAMQREFRAMLIRHAEEKRAKK